MKVALIRQRYTAFGGAERFVSRAVQALQAQGADVTIVTRRWDVAEDLPALACDPFYLGNWWRDRGFARAACKLLERQTFDLVQSHERVDCCDIYRAGDGVHREWLQQRRRALGFWGRIGLWLNPYHHYTLAAEARMFLSPRLKAVICNSRMVKQEIRRHFGLSEDKLHVIYSGVDGNVFHPRLRDQFRTVERERFGIPHQAVLFLFVGSGFARKGLATALLALPSDAHLLVVGKDKHAERYRTQVRKLGIESRVHFAGSQTDVRPCYGAADLLVLPTLYDPFPNVALEALASGLPVATSDKSGAAEFIVEEENGYVCDALDNAALRRNLETFIALSSQRKEEMRTQARHSVESCTLEAMGAQVIALYQELLS